MYKLTPYLKELLTNCKSFEEWFKKSGLKNPEVSSLWMDKKLQIGEFEPKLINNKNYEPKSNT